MTTALAFVFFLLALILFILDAVGVEAKRVNLVTLGLAAFTVPFLVAAWPGS